MATLTITLTAGTEQGALLRKLARKINEVAADVPDRVSTGASTVLTIDNATTAGQIASVQITSGPYAGDLIRV
jgi:outer membrane lipopolysaccharide assembly protein LptE/RlpB